MVEDTYHLIQRSRAEMKFFSLTIFNARSRVSATQVCIDETRRLAKLLDFDLHAPAPPAPNKAT